MPKRIFEEMDNWAGGINTAANADALSLGVSPRGKNSALVQISPNPPRALAAKRKGSAPALEEPLEGEPAIIGQYYFKQSDGTETHVLVCSDGSLRKRGTDGSSETIEAGVFTPSMELLPAFAVANDLLFITNGVEAVKFDGTSVSKFGIAKPASAPSVSAGDSGGSMPAGDWDVLITYYNANTGHESPRSDEASVSVSAGEKVTVTWTDPTLEDGQVTHVRVYVRQRSAGPNFYRVVAGANPAPDATQGGYDSSTLSVELDITADQFENFILLAPDINDNVPPPAGANSPTWAMSRMFVHDGKNIYWSELEHPEAFNIVDSYEPVNPDDGEQVVGLHYAHDRLLILKTRSTWALEGTDPNSWRLELVDPRIGAVNQQCIQTQGATYWWDGQKGPVSYTPGTGVNPIGIPLIGPTIDPDLLNKDKLHLITSVVDDAPSRQRILWAVPELGQDRATVIFPFNTLLGVWESDGWNPFDVASMAVGEDADGTPWVFIGGYSGRLWQHWNALNDGVPNGAVNRGSVVSSTASTLKCVDRDGNAPEWETDELKELYVYAVSQDGLDVQRRRIVGNDGDTLTISPNWGSNPNSTYTYVVGGIDFQWDTPWLTGGSIFRKKRYEFFFVQVASPNSGVPVGIDIFFTYDLLNVAKHKTLNLLGTVVYDSAIYDVDRYASAVLDNKFYRMSKTGIAWRARIRNLNPDEELTLLKVAMQSVLQDHKS